MHEFFGSFMIKKNILVALIIFFFSILWLGFFNLQIVKQDTYLQKSLNNSVRKETLLPVRGLIRDRTGRILVDNTAAYAVAVIPKVVKTAVLDSVTAFLKLDKKRVLKKIKRNSGFRPVTIARDVDRKKLIYLEENRLHFPGVITLLEPKRFYRDSVYSPHLFGAIGEVSVEDQKRNPSYENGELIGKSALEKEYDAELRGAAGVVYKMVDASGRELGRFDNEFNVAPQHGSDIFLTMDYNMQAFAESLMTDKRGALVALDVRTGGVLAMVSKPDYDPRLLAGKIDAATWNKLLNDEGHPLYSRAIQSVYPPGSTYKIVTALAALQEKIITPEWQVYCPGYFKLGRRTIRCWNAGGHGDVDLYGAIKGSCNVYFYKLGLKIGLDIWEKYSKLFAFGSKTGIDLPNESAGLVPSTQYFNRRYGKNGWTKGNLANLAIGQGELLVTPLQMAQFAMILANRGTYYRPHLLDHTYNFAEKENSFYPVEPHYVRGISRENYDVVLEGMRRVMNGGTGWRGKVPGVEMAGKTGTAQNPHGESHAWFITFAPFDIPEVAVAVIIENGGGGGANAAPVARKFLEKYFYNRLIPRPAPKKKIEEELVPIDSLILPMEIPGPMLMIPSLEDSL